MGGIYKTLVTDSYFFFFLLQVYTIVIMPSDPPALLPISDFPCDYVDGIGY